LFLCKLGMHKGEGGSGVIAPSFLTSAVNGSEWSPPSLDRFMLAKAPPEPTKQKAGRASEPVWTLGRKNNLLPLPGIEARFLSFPTRSGYTKPTELSQFLQHLKRDKKNLNNIFLYVWTYTSPTWLCNFSSQPSGRNKLYESTWRAFFFYFSVCEATRQWQPCIFAKASNSHITKFACTHLEIRGGEYGYSSTHS
jgi:hypothetical protein